MENPHKLIAAVVQACSTVFDTPHTIEKVGMLTARAAKSGAQLVVFPEAFVGGYPIDLDFGTRIGMRTGEGRETFRKYYEGAIEVPGPQTKLLSEIAAAHRCYLVVGAVERDGGTLYSTALFFDPQGALLGKHRKVMAVGVERYVWGFGDGSTMPVFNTQSGRIGAVLGCENYMPPVRMAVYDKGVTVYCAPTVDDRDTWLSTARMIAMEGRTFVLSACQFARRCDFPDDYPVHPDVPPDHVLVRGGSCIVNPLGVVLAEPRFNEECILTAELDFADIARGKYDFDVVGHYARADVFRLEIDEQPRPAVKRVTSHYGSEQSYE